MSSESPIISVVIPAHNEEVHLGDVLTGLLPLKSGIRVETIVVDVGSTDRTSEIAATHGCEVLRTHLVYPGIARNSGVHAASAEVIAFLDGDVVVTPSWTSRVLELLKGTCPMERVLTGAPYGIRPQAGWIERTWFGGVSSDPPSYINGGNLLIRRDDFLALGGFDETLPSGEDYELCRRAEREGMTVLIDPQLQTIHLGYPRSAKQFVIREGWHGTGDFTSLSKLLRSKVALATIVFVLSLLSIPVGLLFGSRALWMVGATSTASLCLLASYRRKRSRGWVQVLAVAPISFLYFLGRAVGIFLPSSLLVRWHSCQS